MNESKRDGGQIEAADPERDEEEGGAAVEGEAGEARGRSRRRRPARPARAAEDADAVPADERSREALTFASDIIEKMGMDCDVRLQRREDDESGDIHIMVTGPDAGRIIGKK